LITRVWGGRVVKVVLRLHSLKAETVVSEHGLKEAVCCIYHAPKGIDESSDESSSDSSSDSDSGDDGSARPARRQGAGGGHGHNHNHNHDHGKGKGKGKGRARSPNAYEKVSKPKSGVAKDKS
jgi:protein phosphatase 1 regulatory subunit 11